MASHLKRLKGSINKGTKEGSSPSSSSKPNPPSTDKVRLKCYYNGEITVLVVGLDIKYASLRKKIQDTFGRGVIIYQYEDHEGDRVTVHSKQDIKEAFGIYERLLVKRGKKQGYEPYLKVFLAQRNGTAPALSSSSLASSSSSSSSSTAQQQSTPANPTAPSSLYSSGHSNNISEKRLSSDFVANDTGLDIVETGSPPTPTMTDHTKKSKKGKVRRLTPSLSKVKDKESANSNNSLGSKSPQQSRSSKLPKRKKSSLTKQKPRLTVQTDFSVYGEGSQDSLAAQLGRADWESDPKILSRNYTPSKSALRTPPFLEASDFPSGEFVVPADHSHRLSPSSISSSSPSSLFPPSPALLQSSQPPALSSPDSHLPPTLFPVTVNTISTDTLLTDLHVVEPPPLTAPTSHLPSLYLPSPPLSGPSSYNQSSVLVPPSPSSPRLSLSKKNRRANPDPPPLNSPTSHLPSRALSPSSLSEMLLFTSAPDTLPQKEEEAALPPIHTPTHLSEAEDSETADANGHYHNYESTDEYEQEDESDYTGESEEEEGNDDEDIDEDEVGDEDDEEEEGKDSPPDSDSEYEDERALLRSKPSIRRKNSKNRKSSRLKGKPLQQNSGGNGLRKNTTTNSSLQRLRTSSSDDPLYQLQQAAVQRVAPCDWSKVRWQRGPLIARGGFGDVYMGFKDGQFFAIKQIELQRADGKFLAAIQQEIEVMKTLNHPNIVRYLGTLQQDKFMNIFLEFIPGGSLQTLISRFGALNERTIRIYTRQVLLGLAYLHDNNIVHRDIKGANILVDLEGRAKLADFGCSKKLEGDRLGINKTILGTPWWMAPEVIRQSGHGSPADIWSLGCTVVEMATSKPPWSECTTVVAALWKISSSDKLPEIPSNLSDEAKDFLQACFKRNPNERPTARELLKHPFVSESGKYANGDQTEDIEETLQEDGYLSLGSPQLQRIHSIATFSSSSMFSLLPKEIAMHIFSFLSMSDIDSLAQVCKYWSLLVSELWQSKCVARFVNIGNNLGEAGDGSPRQKNWRRMFLQGNAELRRWEKLQIPAQTLKAHAKTVYTLQFIDSKRFLSGSDDRKLKVWHLEKVASTNRARSIKGHSQGIYCIAISKTTKASRSRIIFTGSSDKSIRLWDAHKYKHLKTWSGAHDWAITSLQHQTSGSRALVSCSLDTTIKLWDIDSGTVIQSLRGHKKGIYCCRVSPSNSNILATGSVDETVRLWDLRVGSSGSGSGSDSSSSAEDDKCVRKFVGHADEVTTLLLERGADGSEERLISGSGDCTIRFWDMGSGRSWRTLGSVQHSPASPPTVPQEPANPNQHSHWVWCLGMVGEHLWSGSQDTTIKCWDVNTGECLKTLSGHKGTVFSLQASKGVLLSGSKDHTIKIWRLPSPE